MTPSRIDSFRLFLCLVLLVWCIQLSAADTSVSEVSAVAEAKSTATATTTAAVLTSSSLYASASQHHGGGVSSVSADVFDTSSDASSSEVELATLLPRPSTSLSAGAWAGIGVAIGVVVAVIVVCVVCGIAKCCGCWCFRPSPARSSSASSFIVRSYAPSSSEHATPASVSPASSCSFSALSQSQCSSESGRRSHSAPPLKRVVAVHSNDSVEAVESITSAFRQFASVSPAMAESSGMETSLSHSQRTVAHHMVPAPLSANPFTPVFVATAPVTAPASLENRSPSPYFWGTPRQSPAQESPQLVLELPCTHRMPPTNRPGGIVRRRSSSSVSFVDISEAL